MPTSWEPMLAKPAATLAAVGSLPGGTVYEPKWDGYRAILERTSAGCRVWSRNGVDLAAGFPEIVQAAREQLDSGTVVDGELVVWRDGRLDFGALAPRLAYRGHRRPPEDLPSVSFLAFDVLAVGDVDMRTEPLRDRRAVLEQLSGLWRPPLQLTPQTADRAEAERWLEEYAAAGSRCGGPARQGSRSALPAWSAGMGEVPDPQHPRGHGRRGHRSRRPTGSADPRPPRRRRHVACGWRDPSAQFERVGRARCGPRRHR